VFASCAGRSSLVALFSSQSAGVASCCENVSILIGNGAEQ
jgi:hypothetical protein